MIINMGMSEREAREEFIGVRLHTDVLELIEERRKEEDMTIADYIRYTVMLDCVYAGKVKAYKIIGSRFSKWFKLVLSKNLEAYQGKKVKVPL
jgi:hypothetical protein